MRFLSSVRCFRIKVGAVPVYISIYPILLLAIGLFTILREICISFILTLIIHELGHVIAVKLTGFKLSHVRFFLCQAAVRASCPYVKEKHRSYHSKNLLVFAAGIIANFMAVFVCATFFNVKEDSIIDHLINLNVLIGVFNLIPLFPSDGYHLCHHFSAFFLSATSSVKTFTRNILSTWYITPVLTLGFIALLSRYFPINILLFCVALQGHKHLFLLFFPATLIKHYKKLYNVV